MRRERDVGEQKDGVRYTSVLREIEELDYAGCILDSSLNYDSYLDQTVLIFYYVVSSFTRITISLQQKFMNLFFFKQLFTFNTIME